MLSKVSLLIDLMICHNYRQCVSYVDKKILKVGLVRYKDAIDTTNHIYVAHIYSDIMYWPTIVLKLKALIQ